MYIFQERVAKIEIRKLLLSPPLTPGKAGVKHLTSFAAADISPPPPLAVSLDSHEFIIDWLNVTLDSIEAAKAGGAES